MLFNSKLNRILFYGCEFGFNSITAAILKIKRAPYADWASVVIADWESVSGRDVWSLLSKFLFVSPSEDTVLSLSCKDTQRF